MQILSPNRSSWRAKRRDGQRRGLRYVRSPLPMRGALLLSNP